MGKKKVKVLGILRGVGQNGEWLMLYTQEPFNEKQTGGLGFATGQYFVPAMFHGMIDNHTVGKEIVITVLYQKGRQPQLVGLE